MLCSFDIYTPRYASPDEISSSPVIILKVVVFPAPLTPNNPKHSP